MMIFCYANLLIEEVAPDILGMAVKKVALTIFKIISHGFLH